MIRSIAFFVIALCLGCTDEATGNNGAKANGSDASDIYGQFLDSWAGKEKEPVNVSRTAKVPSEDELKEFSDCVKDANVHWSPTESIADLTDFVGKLSYVRLIDPDKWNPQDPGRLIAQGKSVDSAVKSGFAHGLMTLSAITFDQSHNTAAFTYSFVCGALCGNGGTVLFVRGQSGWTQSTKQCGSWISYHPGSRPNNSFKPKPLRGSA